MHADTEKTASSWITVDCKYSQWMCNYCILLKNGLEEKSCWLQIRLLLKHLIYQQKTYSIQQTQPDIWMAPCACTITMNIVNVSTSIHSTKMKPENIKQHCHLALVTSFGATMMETSGKRAAESRPHPFTYLIVLQAVNHDQSCQEH